MQLRELIKSQKVLTPMISAQVNNPNSEWDAFSQILAKKSESPAGIAKKEIPSREPSQMLKPKNEVDTERVRPEIRVSEKSYSSPVSNEDKVSSQSKVSEKNEVSSQDRVADREDRPKTEKKAETDTETEATKKLKEALKNKLKKGIKLDDVEIDAMLQSLNLSLPALEQMVNGGEEALTIVANLLETLESLEIDAALEQTLSAGELKQIEGQISQMMQTLTKLSEATSKLTETSKDANGKAHEQQVIQQLSKLLASLNKGEEVKPEALRKSILEALEGKTTESSMISAELEKGVADMPSEAKVPEVALSKGIAKALEQMAKSEQVTTEPKVDLPKQAETPNVAVVRNSEAQAVKQAPSSEATENVEPEIKNVDNKFLSAHQLLMKQGNTLTTPVNQQLQQLKQEVFSQILEAMKGQIKLTDQGASMLVKLQPEQLGNVELKLNIQKGIVLAEIKVENEIVKAAIESNLDDLRQSLNNKGYSVDQINVNIDNGKNDQQEAFNFLNQGQNGKKGGNGQLSEKTVQTEQVETLSRYIIDELEGTTFNYYG